MQVESGLVGVEESLAALAKFVDSEERALQDAIEYILRQMCNYVKQNGPWTDRTTNLRNSISINIETMTEWPADTPAETLKALVSQNETPLIEISGDDFAGCLSAGMEYSIFVELKEGFWVLQGAIDRFEPLIDKYFTDKMQVDKLDLIVAADIQYSTYLSRKGLNESEITSRIQAKHDYYNGR
jgi:hypothetical protein